MTEDPSCIDEHCGYFVSRMFSLSVARQCLVQQLMLLSHLAATALALLAFPCSTLLQRQSSW